MFTIEDIQKCLLPSAIMAIFKHDDKYAKMVETVAESHKVILKNIVEHRPEDESYVHHMVRSMTGVALILDLYGEHLYVDDGVVSKFLDRLYPDVPWFPNISESSDISEPFSKYLSEAIVDVMGYKNGVPSKHLKCFIYFALIGIASNDEHLSCESSDKSQVWFGMNSQLIKAVRACTERAINMDSAGKMLFSLTEIERFMEKHKPDESPFYENDVMNAISEKVFDMMTCVPVDGTDSIMMEG